MEGLPVGEVVVERYRPLSLTAQRAMDRISTTHKTVIARGFVIKALPTERGIHTPARWSKSHTLPIDETGYLDGRMNPTAPCTPSGSPPRRMTQLQESSKASAATYRQSSPVPLPDNVRSTSARPSAPDNQVPPPTKGART